VACARNRLDEAGIERSEMNRDVERREKDEQGREERTAVRGRKPSRLRAVKEQSSA
jgi:hypothetical protein